LDQFCQPLYIGHLWDAFFAEHGIWREHTVEGMLQQGGVTERCNCTLEEHVVAMLNGARLLTRFWGEVLYTYGRLLNMTPLSAIPPDMTPYKMAHKRKPDYSTLRIFGCRAWAHVHCKKRRSLEPHAKPCVFLGIPDNFKGWKLWDPSAQGGCGSVIISRNVIWNKEEFPGLSKDVHNPIPAHFGCIDAKTPAAAKPSTPVSEESAEDSDEQEGDSLPLPALVPLDDNVGHVCHGQLQASCGALTCLSDCNYYIGTGGVTEVAHRRLSSYHDLQSVLAQQVLSPASVCCAARRSGSSATVLALLAVFRTPHASHDVALRLVVISSHPPLQRYLPRPDRTARCRSTRCK
jgi:hypothetical protein